MDQFDISEISFWKGLLLASIFSIIIAIIVFLTSLFVDLKTTLWETILLCLFPVLLFIIARIIKSIDDNTVFNIRKHIVIQLMGTPFMISFGIIFWGGLITKVVGIYVYDYINSLDLNKYLELKESGYFNILVSLNHVIYFIHQNYIIFLVVIPFIVFWIYTAKGKVSFICPHCLKKILFKNLSKLYCELCRTGNHSRFELLLKCSDCKEKFNLINCPHCSHVIDVSIRYDEYKLRDKRKQSVIVKPILMTGLREIYNLEKRLPKFICKHCLNTLLTKNYNLLCPYCKAKYLVTDNRTQVQIGDVKIQNYRYVGDESTMEKVLFESCIQCDGIIENIKCYHDDCLKTISLTEKYDEVELLRRRYEQENS